MNNQDDLLQDTAGIEDQAQPIGGDNNFVEEAIVADGGAEEAGGHMQDLESDDNALDMAKNAGLYNNAGEMSQPELNIANEVEKAEKAHQED